MMKVVIMKKTERQNGIVHLLRIKKKMNAQDLANYFEVSERTIYRDIDALSQLHVPIIAYEGAYGGYEIDPTYFLPSIKLNEQEILMLLMVLKAGERLRFPNMVKDYNLLSTKVINALTDEERQKAMRVLSHIEFDGNRIKPKGYTQDVLTPILEAFWKSCDLLVAYYHPEKDVTEERRFSPTQLSFEEGGWYVMGFCHLRQAKRTFRMDRIKSMTCLNEINQHMNKPLTLPENDKFTWHTYELLIDPALYRIIKEDDYLEHVEILHADAQHAQLSDLQDAQPQIHLTIRTPYKNVLLQLILGHPEQVTVLKPDWFIHDIEKISHSLCKKYLKL